MLTFNVNLNLSLNLSVYDVQDVQGRQSDEPFNPFSDIPCQKFVEFGDQIDTEWLETPVDATNNKGDKRNSCKNLFHLLKVCECLMNYLYTNIQKIIPKRSLNKSLNFLIS